MITLCGKGVYGGVAIGKLSFFHRTERKIEKRTIANTHDELLRYDRARTEAKNELQRLYEATRREIDEESAAIFEIHKMMLDDDDLNGEIQLTIKNDGVNAEYAVHLVCNLFCAQFEAMNDSYMQARSADIRDISRRLLSNLMGGEPNSHRSSNEGIICADDLTPSEAMTLDKDKISAFVTAGGSPVSHTAILARSMGIPAVIGVGEDLTTLSDGAEAIVDGFDGKVYILPDEKTKIKMIEKMIEDKRKKALLDTYKGLDNVTLDGRRIDVFANIQSPKEVKNALSNDAGGIGLFRSEFLYLDRHDAPNEEEQFEAYKTVLTQMSGKKVVIRTLDIGADKQVAYLSPEKEDNPALGLRAIRLCLKSPHIFKVQLRALLRASSYGSLAIMFPMISSVDELLSVKAMVDEVKSKLMRENVPFCETTELGIMIETPAAAIISDRLAPLVDFFSIGTNDLTQYTLALDRQNRHLEEFLDPHHEAVMRLIELTVKNAHAQGKWVGICGELGADEELTEKFLRMEIDELSVSPSYILPLRDKIRKTDLSEKGDNKK